MLQGKKIIGTFCLCLLIAHIPSCIFAQRVRNNNALQENATTKNATGIDTAQLNRKKEHHDNSVNITYHYLHDSTARLVDTSILFFQTTAQPNNWNQHAGTYGSAIYPLLYNHQFVARQQLGFSQNYLQYNTSADSVPLYNSNKPYTVFSYQSARLKEQHGGILHTQNRDSNRNFSFQYSKQYTPGFFLNQTTNSDHFVTSAYWKWKRIPWFRTQLNTAWHQNRQAENGGIVTDTLLPYANYALRTTIPVHFSSTTLSNSAVVSNYNRNNSLVWLNTITPSRSLQGKHAQLLLQHCLRLYNDKQVYNDKQPDTARYSSIASLILLNRDTIVATHRLLTLQNELGFSLPMQWQSKAQLSAAIGFELQRFSIQNSNTWHYSNYINSNLHAATRDGKWQIQGAFTGYVVGYAAGNYMWRANAEKKFNNLELALQAEQSLEQAPRNVVYYASNFYSWQNNFDKISTTKLSAIGRSNKNKWQLQASLYNIYNMLYWDSAGKAQQYDTLAAIAQVQGTKIFTWRHWHLQQSVFAQQQLGNAPINICPAAARSILAYNNYIFKKSVLASLGVDVYYNAPYKTPSYNPIVNQYSFSNNYRQSNVPRVNFFFNSKIKRFRAYIAAEEMQQLLNSNNRILIKDYPATDWMLRAGFAWVMVN